MCQFLLSDPIGFVPFLSSAIVKAKKKVLLTVDDIPMIADGLGKSLLPEEPYPAEHFPSIRDWNIPVDK